MSAPTISATRLSTDIELRPVHSKPYPIASSSEPQILPSLPHTTRSSAISLPQAEVTAETDPDPLNSQSLLPVDKGKDAWLFLLGATVIEILIWGLPYSIGVLHLYWTNTLFPGQGATTITLAATLQSGFLYLSVAVFGPLITAFPRYTKYSAYAGFLISTIGFITSGFATEPWHLIVTFGFLYPFATAAYVPAATILFEWFSAKRGLAAGIMYAGTGIGGTIFPFVISSMISSFGYKTAMISMGLGYGILGGIALIPIKRRIPIPGNRRGAVGVEAIRVQRPNLGFLRRRLTWIGFGIIVVSSLGNFIPSLWLPAYADDLHVSPSGTGLISIMNAASVPGNAIIGYLSDRYPISLVILYNCIGTALACFFLWGFGTNGALLVSFVLVFGLLGLGFVSTWTRMISTIARDDPTVPAMAFSLFAVAKGIGSMSSGPIADQLLKVGVLKGAAGGYGVNNYGILLIYTGVSILVAGATGLTFRERK